MKIAIINGPNLNFTGKREPQHYGSQNFDEMLKDLSEKYPAHKFSYFQNNVEGEIINRLHESDRISEGVILNAGAYTHTSLAIADAIKAINIPVIEVHLSNIFAREDHRHISHTGACCAGSISGMGMLGYELAVISLEKLSETGKK